MLHIAASRPLFSQKLYNVYAIQLNHSLPHFVNSLLSCFLLGTEHSRFWINGASYPSPAITLDNYYQYPCGRVTQLLVHPCLTSPAKTQSHVRPLFPSSYTATVVTTKCTTPKPLNSIISCSNSAAQLPHDTNAGIKSSNSLTLCFLTISLSSSGSIL